MAGWPTTCDETDAALAADWLVAWVILGAAVPEDGRVYVGTTVYAGRVASRRRS
jgi:hypothetical protein